MVQCNAKSKRTGEKCKGQAITGKDKCRMHGGRSPIKHGLYSKYAPPKLSQKIEEFRGHPQLLDLREQILFQLSLQNDLLEHYKDSELRFDSRSRESLLTISDVLSKNIERLNKIENGEKFTLRIEVMQKAVLQIVEVVKHYVTDPRAREKLATELCGISAD